VWAAPQAPPLAEPPRDCLKSYPVQASDLSGIDGTTEVTYDIVHGEVQNASVTHSSGSAALDKSALDCISTRRFAHKRILVSGPFGPALVDKSRAVTVHERIKWADALKR
jgi:TonB family protein